VSRTAGTGVGAALTGGGGEPQRRQPTAETGVRGGSGDRGVVVWWSHGGEVGGCSDLEEEAWGGLLRSGDWEGFTGKEGSMGGKELWPHMSDNGVRVCGYG